MQEIRVGDRWFYNQDRTQWCVITAVGSMYFDMRWNDGMGGAWLLTNIDEWCKIMTNEKEIFNQLIDQYYDS